MFDGKAARHRSHISQAGQTEEGRKRSPKKGTEQVVLSHVCLLLIEIKIAPPKEHLFTSEHALPSQWRLVRSEPHRESGAPAIAGLPQHLRYGGGQVPRRAERVSGIVLGEMCPDAPHPRMRTPGCSSGEQRLLCTQRGV